MPVFWLSDEYIDFPDPQLANEEGVLGIGGDLSTERLLLAYQLGIFPWYNPGEPIMWWSPDPRFVLYPDELKVAKSMRPYFNQKKFGLTFDTTFEQVMRSCQTTERKGQLYISSWITEEMIHAYVQLHQLGFAHSVEVWSGEALVGGLYGIAIGKVFFGESMFTKVSNASKFGFISLVRKLREQGFWLVDCQQQTHHLASLGAKAIKRKDFLDLLEKNIEEPTLVGSWQSWAE
ncbi:MAG: leucyl/phenylalanyl-tRNA--protein transferase [Bacteroidota bacterium]